MDRSGSDLLGAAMLSGPELVRHVPGARGLVVLPVSRTQVENRLPRGAVPAIRRQMALDCGLKSLPVSSGWKPTGRLDRGETKLGQSNVFLQAPEEKHRTRRGLSGSKVRNSSNSARPGSHTPRSSSVSGFSQDGPEGGYSLTPSPRPLSLKFNTRFSLGQSEDHEDEGVVSGYSWNASDQGLRLKRELTKLSSSRAMKRASEIVSHRVDPMYCMAGSKMSLQSRYGIEDEEMRKLQQMAEVREGLVSDLRKMKFHYGGSGSVHTMKNMKKLESEGHGAPNGQRSQPASHRVFPSSPASDMALHQPEQAHVQTHRQQERAPSEHSDTDNSLIGPD